MLAHWSICNCCLILAEVSILMLISFSPKKKQYFQKFSSFYLWVEPEDINFRLYPLYILD